jgi:Arc/MetJ-type ribon-helix-helix transcriptional regulator
MTIQLPPELDRMVKAKVDSGLYANETDVVCHALRRELADDDVQQWVREAAAAGFEQLASGEFEEITREELLVRLASRRAR